ncbi:MAG: nuclear transport factor 2 family protein [Cytophagales bacterium]|nr:nuclear transport factor 2 family protein [Cytophagales bacterium]
METQVMTMTTEEIAEKLVSLSREGKFEQIHQELFSPEIISVEPTKEGGWEVEKGFDGLKKKAEQWHGMVEEMIGGEISDPIVAGNHFSCTWKTKVRFKGAPEAVAMDEVAVYEVKNGKVVLEQFFYTPF